MSEKWSVGDTFQCPKVNGHREQEYIHEDDDCIESIYEIGMSVLNDWISASLRMIESNEMK